ncbi:MAG TPA: DUF4126 domain-containing protein [Methylomirabilota bacterium]|nr:DUF4126 domain-containing protein [Methylomirabilota bacterium]
MDLLLSLCIGLGLSAACGFRIFVPLLITSIAAHAGHLSLAPSFDWIASTPAMAAFGIATALEIGGYYIPWVDNFLDTVATPAAIVAGSIVTASMVTDVSPFMQWSLGIIAGGGIAGAVQGMTVLVRGASTATTAGLANPLFATAELGGAIGTAFLAIVAPIVALIAVAAVIGWVILKLVRRTTKVAL